MSYDTESQPLPDDEEFIEKSVNENSRSNSNSGVSRTAISRKHPSVVKCESALTSTDNEENDRLLVASVIGKAETRENDKYETDKTISIVDKETRNNSKVKFLSFPDFLPVSFSIRFFFFFFETFKFRY